MKKETQKSLEETERDLDEIASMIVTKQGFDLAEGAEALTADLRKRGITVVTPQVITAVVFGIDTIQRLVNQMVVDGEGKMQILKLFASAEVPIRAIKRHLEQGYKPTGKVKPATLALGTASGRSSDYSGSDDEDEGGKHYGFKS